MVQGTLLEMLIDDGKRLIGRLTEVGVPVKAGFWAKESESGQWFLYLVTPLVGEDGATRRAYRRVNAVIRQLPAPSWIDPMEIKVIGVTDPIAKDLFAVHQGTGGVRNHLIRWGDKRLGNLSIEDAYLYPLPAGASS